MTFLEFSDITMTAYISYAQYARSYTKFFIKLPQNMWCENYQRSHLADEESEA